MCIHVRAGNIACDLLKVINCFTRLPELTFRILPSKLPALQTPTEVKEREGPLEIDSSPPDSPDSASSMTNSKDAVAMAKEAIAMRKAKVNLNMRQDGLQYFWHCSIVMFLALTGCSSTNCCKFHPYTNHSAPRLAPTSPRIWLHESNSAFSHLCYYQNPSIKQTQVQTGKFKSLFVYILCSLAVDPTKDSLLRAETFRWCSHLCFLTLCVWKDVLK